MRVRRWVFLLLGLPALAWADGVPSDPLSLLQQMARAAHEQGYQGTFVTQRGGDMQASHVIHAKIDGDEETRVNVLDGQPHEIIRVRQMTRCYYPMQRKVRVESDYRRQLFPALIEAPYGHYLDFYEVSERGLDRVAGLECRKIFFHARDRERFDHEFCAETQTGLILRAVTFDQQGGALETVQFTDIERGIHPRAEVFKPAYRDLAAWQTVHFPALEAVEAPLPIGIGFVPTGFSKILEMTLKPRPDQPNLHHWVYSDGLSSFSVFVRSEAQGEPGHPVARTLKSALSYYAVSLPQYHVVVLGDVPQATVVAIGQSIFITEDHRP